MGVIATPLMPMLIYLHNGWCLFIDRTMLPVWKLIGFILYVILYYAVLDAHTAWPTEPSLKTVFFKVMPVVHLAFIVISTSMDDDIKVKSSKYRWNIALGLIASGIGDCCTVFIEYPGVIIFSIAHLFYICAFGIHPLGSGPTAASFAIAAASFYFFFVFDVLPMSTFKVMLVIYLLLLFIMAWRSMVVLHSEKSFDSFLAFLGTTLFIVADAMFSVDRFHGSFNRAPFWVMLAYYGAQLGIALSACDSHSPSLLKKDY